MTEWDRKALLQLVDEAGLRLVSLPPDASQRHALHSLVHQFGAKAKSITASRDDVLNMQTQLARILGDADDES